MIPRNPGTLHERQRRDTYTPVWTSSGTAPFLGNGTITGLYSVRDDEVHVVINVTFGSTSTYGTGWWSFSLPFPSHASLFQLIDGYVVDTSATNYAATSWAIPQGSATAGGGLQDQVTTTGATLVGTGQPFTWATGDAVYICGTYFASST